MTFHLPLGTRARIVYGLALDPLATLERLHREHGDVHFVDLPGQPTWLLHHPDHVHEVLVADHASYRKDAMLRMLSDILGEGLLTSEGAPWKRHRRLAQPGFHSSAIRGYGETMATLASARIEGWRPGPLDLHAEMAGITLQIVARTLFGADLGEHEAQIAASLDTYLRGAFGAFGTGVRLPPSVPTPGNLRRRRVIRRLHAVIDEMIAVRRATPDRSTLLGMLIEATDDEGASFGDTQLRDEAITLLLAGHETTAVALTYTAYLLAHAPDVERRLHAELDEVLDGRLPGVDDVPKLPYTAAVVQEAMRLYPPAWAIGREATVPTELSGGHRIRPGDQLWLDTWLIHRDPRWYADPLVFRPERWTPELERSLPRCAYIPFGGGPRACIGKRFAELEAVLVLAVVASRFRLRLAPGETLRLLPTVTLRPDGGLRMVAEPR